MKNITGRLLIYLLTYLLLLNHAPVKAAADNPKGGEPPKFSETAFGRVTVGKPKIWKFDRIYSTLDGLLRDIDAVQLASLTALDASQANQTTLDFLSSSFNVNAGFNQKAGTVNALELEKINAIRPLELQRLKAFNEKRLQAEQRNIEVNRQLAAARDRKANLDPDSTNFERDKAIETAKITALTEELTEISATLAQSPPSLTSVDKSQFEDAVGIQPTPLPTPLISAGDLKDAVIAKVNNSAPSLPATKILDNFITLLHERLSRQLSIAFDDNGRSKDLYLVQFDVGVYPYKDAENHVLCVEFDMEQGNGKTPPRAYDLYPAASSYNMTEYWGKSRGTGIAGSAAFLFGFGIGAEYKRQRDQVRSALTQNVYMSGFGAGTSKFGWYIGSAPFEKLISPGTRPAFAVIAVEKDGMEKEGLESVKFTPSVKWVHRSKGSGSPPEILASVDVESDYSKLAITRLAYQTQYAVNSMRSNANESEQDKGEEFATVQLTFNETIDPNLVITVNGALLPRLRDQRGRATTEKSATTNENNHGPKGAMFGLLETDSDGGSHWFAMGARSISLKLAKSLVGSETFPRIRFLSAGTNGEVELRQLLDDKRLPVRGKQIDYGWDIFVNDFHFTSNNLKGQPPPPQSAFLPLFSAVDYVKGSYAWMENNEINIVYKEDLPSGHTQIDDRSQVVLIRKNDKAHFPLDCSGFGELTCRAPRGLSVDVDVEEFQISIERPARAGLKGVADKIDLKKTPPPKDPKLKGDYELAQVKTSAGEIRGWYFSLPAENLDGKKDEIHGFGALLAPKSPCPTFTSSTPTLVLGDDANYQVSESKIEIWVPLRHLAALLQSRLNLKRGGVLQFDLPDIARGVLPSVSNIRRNNGYIVIEGGNLGLVETVIISGCGAKCEKLSTGGSNGLITFAAPQNTNGVFPIQLRLKGGPIVIDAAKVNGETWSVILTAPTTRATSIASENKSKSETNPSSPPKSNRTPSALGSLKEENSFLLSPPPPQPTPTPKTQERNIRGSKQNTVN